MADPQSKPVDISQVNQRVMRNRARRNYHQRHAILEQMTDEAFDVLRELLSSQNESVRLAAARETLDRAQGKPRQVQQVNVQATDMTALHLAALRTLATSTQAIDITPNKVLDHVSQ
jgi:hypothetical protein